eukprot:Colp12_sorted_trinity150504_noHs@27635
MADNVAIGLIEKDKNADVLWVWSYPTIDDVFRNLLLKKANLGSSDTVLEFIFGKFRGQWYYIFSAPNASPALPKVTTLSLALISKVFNPEKYYALLKRLGHTYMVTGSTAAILQGYLSVVTRGACEGGSLGKYIDADYDIRKAYISTSIKEVINTFGMDVILIYVGMLLKKRIIVYAPTVDVLLNTVRAFPLFVFQRLNWNLLWPHVSMDNIELEELKKAGVYVAGFTDPAIENKEELFDLFVNVQKQSITISSKAREDFGVGKWHKDLATFLVDAVDNKAATEQQVIKALALKTQELINNLKSFDDSGEVTQDVLKERKLPPAMHVFLWNVACAEGFAKR